LQALEKEYLAGVPTLKDLLLLSTLVHAAEVLRKQDSISCTGSTTCRIIVAA
jgi:hypothetical protein